MRLPDRHRLGVCAHVSTATAASTSNTAAVPYASAAVPIASTSVTARVPAVLPIPSASEDTELAAVSSSGVRASVGISEWCEGRDVVIVAIAMTAPA